MKSSLRAMVLSVIVSLSLACATITNPQGLLRPGAAATRPVGISLATQLAGTLEAEMGTTPEAAATPAAGGLQLATQLAGTLEAEMGTTPEAGATPEGGDLSAMSTALAATLQAAAGGGTPDMPAALTAAAGVLASTPGASSAGGAYDPVRVVDSLNVLLGDQSGKATLPSYHLEVTHLSPVMVNGAVAQAKEQVSADVQGANVHYTDTNTKPGGQPVSTEFYLIGDTYYAVKNGKVSPDLGMAALGWSSWPMNVFTVLGMGSLKSAASGTDTLDGRAAEVYTLSGTSADDTTGALASVGLPVSKVTGQLWIDHETGALLKTVLDYEAQVSASGSSTKATGSGHLEVTVTQVGQVTVKDPTK